MHTITLQVNDDSALRSIEDLASKHLVSVVEDYHSESSALPGNAMSLAAYKKWVESSENAPSISLDELKEKWSKNSSEEPSSIRKLSGI